MSRIQADEVALANDSLAPCCCREKMAKLKPLTVEWFRSAMQPRYAEDGTVTYVLTPPRRPVVTRATVIGAVFFLLVLFALANWARALGVFG